MKTRLLALCIPVSLIVVGCQTSTPQASEEVKKQVLGRQPTEEEMRKAMGSANDRLKQAQDSAGK